jgi:hypothetical protein
MAMKREYLSFHYYTLKLNLEQACQIKKHLDFLIKNNIHPRDAHALISSLYQELSYFGKSYDALFNMEDFFIEDGGYVANMDGKFVDYEGKELEESEDLDEEECDCKGPKKMDITEVLKYGLGMYIATQTNQLASQDREAYIKDLLRFTTQRKEASFIESLETLGISQEQFETASIVEPRIKDELTLTRKMWKFK